MIRNWLILTVRSLLRYKTFSFINLAGLTISMACCILLATYLRYELEYDRFHRHADDIYRVVSVFDISESNASCMVIGLADASASREAEGHQVIPTGPSRVGEVVRDAFPEVSAVVRYWEKSTFLTAGDRVFQADQGFFLTDPEFLTTFDFPLLKGDPTSALSEPYTIVVTDKIAQKIWGDEDPIGKTLRYGTIYDLTVTGVIAAPPENSHLQFDYLCPASTSLAYWGSDEDFGNGMWSYGNCDWCALTIGTYVRLVPGVDHDAFLAKFNEWSDREMDADQRVFRIRLQALSDIHLSGAETVSDEGNIDVRYVYLLMVIVALILCIASANYMTLSTARSATRAREVGVRKVMGAGRFALMRGFLGESVLFSVVALLLAMGIAEALLPMFSGFMQRDLELRFLDHPAMTLSLIGIAVLVGVLSGLYPAVFLSSFRPALVIKGVAIGGAGGRGWFRRALVVGQYAVSALLVICTVVVAQQLQYIRHKELGFRHDDTIVVSIRARLNGASVRALKSELLQLPGVAAVSGAGSTPATNWNGAGMVWWDGSDESDRLRFSWTKVDYDFFDLYGIPIVSGRAFSRDNLTDAKSGVILNETAVRAMGWTPEEAIGRQWGLHPRDKRSIVGVARDFHYASLHRAIEPAAILLSPNEVWMMSIRLTGVDRDKTLETVTAICNRHSPDSHYTFVADTIESWYRTEQRLATVLTAGAATAIFIACLGLFGLALFTAERRAREIGIRKILGASVTGVTALLTRQFIVWVVIANVIAWPLAWYAMDRWLQQFAYRIDLDWMPFAAAGGLALVVALLTIAVQTIKAAMANPVEVIRYE